MKRNKNSWFESAMYFYNKLSDKDKNDKIKSHFWLRLISDCLRKDKSRGIISNNV